MKFPSCEFDDAVAALCHGTINEEELADLHGLLCVDSGARDEYLWRVEVHGELASGKLNFDNLSECEEVDASAKIYPISDSIVPRVEKRRYLPMRVAAAILILIVLGGGMLIRYGFQIFPAKSEVVAQFTGLQDCRWMVSTTRVSSGDPIHIGQRIELLSGSADVEFESGARMTVLGPSILVPLSNNSVFLMQGQARLMAETPDSKGFKLETPNSMFVDIGTAFTAKVTPDGLNRVNVSEGEVDVVLEGIKSPPRLRIGETLYIEPGERRVMTRIEPGDGTASFRFPNIAPPSSDDYADQVFGHAGIRVVQGQLRKYPGQNAPETLLLDGMGQSNQDSPRSSAFFNHHSGGSFLIDLGQSISVTKVNSYSWHQNERNEEHRQRATQKFTLYGFSGDQLPDMELLPHRGGWTRIARVNTDAFFEVDEPLERPAQQACSITAAHGEIGRFRYLLWEVNGGTFFSEFDVYGSP
ncbi:MAG: FecR family protein [Phycisphaerae bacterium]|nr:FecR family protein [Phycisphaerae bacterium]